MDGELGPAHGVIGRAGALHILACRLDAEPEDPGDFPVGLAARDELEALDLASAESGARRRRRKGPQSPRGAKRMRAYCLGAAQPSDRKVLADPDRERAGSARFPRHVRRNRETAAESMVPAAREDASVAALERDDRA